MIGIINQIHDPHPALIQLPKGDLLRVRTPPETASQAEFFFVDPIEGAVDYGGRSVGGQGGDLEGVHVLDVEIVGFDVGYHVAAGGEGGEHQGGGFGGWTS